MIVKREPISLGAANLLPEGINTNALSSSIIWAEEMTVEKRVYPSE